MTYFRKLQTFGYMNPGPVPTPTPSPNRFDPCERRFFWGRPASVLIDYAKDQDWLKFGLGKYRRPDGAAQRFTDLYHVGEGFLKALTAYVMVKWAIRLMMTPFQKRRAPKRIIRKAPRVEYVWRTAPPTSKDWAKLDLDYGFDVRGTSPLWIEKRARQLRKAMWAQPKSTGTQIEYIPNDNQTEIKTLYRDYAPELDDLFSVMPPVKLPDISKPYPEEPPQAASRRTVQRRPSHHLDDPSRRGCAAPQDEGGYKSNQLCHSGQAKREPEGREENRPHNTEISQPSRVIHTKRERHQSTPRSSRNQKCSDQARCAPKRKPP